MSNESDTNMTDSDDVQNEAMDFDIPEEMETPQETPEAEAAEETPEPEEPKDDSEQDAEYVLDLEELDDGDKPYVGILTEHAKNAGIDAKKASKFIIGFTKGLHAYHAEQVEEDKQALRKEWGKDFKSKHAQTKAFMSRLFAKAKLSDEERSMFSNAAGYRICRKFMTAMGEKGGGSAPTSTPMSKQERVDAEVIKLVEMQADPKVTPAMLAGQKAKINTIAGMVLY